MDLIIIIWDILIEYRGKSSDSFNSDFSFCALWSWAS